MEIFKIRNYLSHLLCTYLTERDEISGDRLKALFEILKSGKARLNKNLMELPEEFPVVKELDGYITLRELDEFTKEYLSEKLKMYQDFLQSIEGFKPPESIEDTIILARKLFKKGLYFEVHELLEDIWMGEYGELREFLQALIQIAVAYYHLNNYNQRGYELLIENASSLLEKYSGKIYTVNVDKLKEELKKTTPEEIVYF